MSQNKEIKAILKVFIKTTLKPTEEQYNDVAESIIQLQSTDKLSEECTDGWLDSTYCQEKDSCLNCKVESK